MKKKIILLIIAIIISMLLLTMYITTLASDYNIGDTVKLGMHMHGATITGATNITDSHNYFCASHGTDYGSYAKAIQYYVAAKVQIVGNTVTLTASENYGGTNTKNFTFVESRNKYK